MKILLKPISLYSILLFWATVFYFSRVPGFSYSIIVLFLSSIYILLNNQLKISLDKYRLFFLLLMFYMLLRCVIAFLFYGEYEERYFSSVFVFFIFTLSCFNVERGGGSQVIYDALVVAICLSVAISFFEITTNIHMPTSRYADVSNAASGWSVMKPTAFYYNENDMLNFMVCFLPIALSSIRQSIIKILVLSSVFFLALYIGSKAAIIALIFYVVFFNILPKKVILLLSFVFLACFISISDQTDNQISLVLSKASARLLGFFNVFDGSSNAVDDSTSERLSIYGSNMLWLAEHPLDFLFGHGLFSSYESDLIREFGLRIAEFHNIHFEMITIYGVLFYLLFLIYYIGLWRKLFFLSTNGNSYKRMQHKALLTSAIMYPIIISFGPSSSLKYPFLLMLVLLMLLSIRESTDEKKA